MTTTTDTVIAAAQTVEAGGNFYQVEALLAAYGDILEQAKKQLENYEPSEQDFRRMTDALSCKIDYHQLAYCAIDSMADENAPYQASQALERLVQRVGNRIDDKLVRAIIRSEISDLVNQRFNDLVQETKAIVADILNTERRAVERENYELRAAMRTIFSSVLKDQLRQEVRDEMDSVYQARQAAENS